MGRIALEDLRPGMVLAEDARASGNVLLSAGTTLTEQHIATFRSWGLSDAEIEGLTDEELNQREASSLDPAKLEEAKLLMQDHFSLTNTHDPFMAELQRTCIIRKAREL